MAIFSGPESEELWQKINALNSSHPAYTRSILYLLGCKCQELEAEVERLKQMNKTGDNKAPVKSSKKFKASNKPTKTGKDNRLIKKG